MARKMMDCRDMPSEKGCTLTIAGEEDEVLRAAVLHAVDAHGEHDTPQFRDQVRGALKAEGGEAPRARR
jgi:predicted small metal-binding protein